MAAVALAVTGRDLPPGQVLELGIQAGLVLFHDQDVMSLLGGHEEFGVVALGMHRVCGNDAPRQVQGFQQRDELGDLVGLAIHAGLGYYGAGLLVGCCQQVHSLPARAGVAGAAQRLAVQGQRRPRSPAGGVRLACGPQPGGEPGPHRGVERGGVHGFQDPADGGLTRRLEPAGEGIVPDPEHGQDLRGRVRDPLTDRRERPRPGQHRRHRCQ